MGCFMMEELSIEQRAWFERAKEEASIDRSETCFAGVGTIGSKHLSPDPEGSERLRTQNYL